MPKFTSNECQHEYNTHDNIQLIAGSPGSHLLGNALFAKLGIPDICEKSIIPEVALFRIHLCEYSNKRMDNLFSWAYSTAQKAARFWKGCRPWSRLFRGDERIIVFMYQEEISVARNPPSPGTLGWPERGLAIHEARLALW